MSNACHAFGLPVATEMAIPGAIPAEATPGAQPAFSVKFGAIGLGKAESGLAGRFSETFAGRQDGPYRVRADGLLFEKQGVARYLCCRDGELLIVDPVPGAPEGDVEAYLIATALPGLLWMRGDMVLHGAVAVLPGESQAVGLLGVSGAGKSRLLLQIAEAGGRVLAEDSFRVWAEDGGLLAAGLPGLIHGREAGAGLDGERHVHKVPAGQQMIFAELSRLVVLELGQSEDTSAEPGRDAVAAGPVRLHGVPAFAAVMRNRHRPRIPDLLGLSAGVLPRCGALARELPVYSWEFLQAASRSPAKGGTWRTLAGL